MSIASPPTSPSDEPSQDTTVTCQFGLARLVSAGRRAEPATGGSNGQGPLVPTSASPPAVAPEPPAAWLPSTSPSTATAPSGSCPTPPAQYFVPPAVRPVTRYRCAQ